MLHSIAVWLLVVAFVGAGLFNAIGTRATQDDFARWGPALVVSRDRWFEIVAAALIAFLPAGAWNGARCRDHCCCRRHDPAPL